MAIAALVLGIISIILGLFLGGILGWLCLIVSIAGIILGAMGRNDEQQKSLATAGLVMSIVGMALGVVEMVVCSALNEVFEDIFFWM